jgi:hypothetical protein
MHFITSDFRDDWAADAIVPFFPEEDLYSRRPKDMLTVMALLTHGT